MGVNILGVLDLSFGISSANFCHATWWHVLYFSLHGWLSSILVMALGFCRVLFVQTQFHQLLFPLPNPASTKQHRRGWRQDGLAEGMLHCEPNSGGSSQRRSPWGITLSPRSKAGEDRFFCSQGIIGAWVQGFQSCQERPGSAALQRCNPLVSWPQNLEKSKQRRWRL